MSNQNRNDLLEILFVVRSIKMLTEGFEAILVEALQRVPVVEIDE